MKTILIIILISTLYGVYYSIKEVINNHKEYINHLKKDDE